MQMIQQSQIPTSVTLESISPEENYSTDDKLLSSSSPSTASPPFSSSSGPPFAAARKTQFSKPYEQQQNSARSEDSTAQQRGEKARARPARVEQDNEEEQAVPSDSQEEEQHASAQSHVHQSTSGDQLVSQPAPNPEETSASPNSASPNSAHRSPDQVLSPTGYILGFVHANPTSHSSNPSSPFQTPHSLTTEADSEPQSGEHSAESPSESFLHTEDQGDARSAAVQLLLGFMGALQASQYAVESFVSNVVHYYRYAACHSLWLFLPTPAHDKRRRAYPMRSHALQWGFGLCTLCEIGVRSEGQHRYSAACNTKL